MIFDILKGFGPLRFGQAGANCETYFFLAEKRRRLSPPNNTLLIKKLPVWPRACSATSSCVLVSDFALALDELLVLLAHEVDLPFLVILEKVGVGGEGEQVLDVQTVEGGETSGATMSRKWTSCQSLTAFGIDGHRRNRTFLMSALVAARRSGFVSFSDQDHHHVSIS